MLIDIQVNPLAPANRADGLHGDADQPALKVRLNAQPVDGKANDALLKWLASEPGVPRKMLSVIRGETSGRKQIRLAAEAAGIARWQALITLSPVENQ